MADKVIGAGWRPAATDEWLLTGSGRPGEYDVLARPRLPKAQPRLLVTGLSYDQANTLVVEHNYPLMTITRKRGDEIVSSMIDFEAGPTKKILRGVSVDGHFIQIAAATHCPTTGLPVEECALCRLAKRIPPGHLGAGHEPEDNPTIWLRHISTHADISDKQAWELLLLQAVERLREMRHGVIHSGTAGGEGPIWMTLRIELR